MIDLTARSVKVSLYALKRPLVRMALRYLALRDRWEAAL